MRDDSSATNSPAERGLSAQSIWFGLLATLGVVLVLLFLADVPNKLARWHWAAAYDRYLDGDLAAAIAALEPAFGWDDSMPELYYQRAQWHMQAGEFAKALTDFNRALELTPQSGGTLQFRLQVNDAACQALRRLGRCQEMSERQDAFVRIVERNFAEKGTDDVQLVVRSLALNSRAYANALCGLKLDESLADVKQAIHDRLAVNEEQRGRFWKAAFLDTRGYLLLRMGKFAAAAEELERAVAIAEQDFNDEVRDDAASERFVDRRPVEMRERERRQVLAVLYQHRGQAYEELGRRFDAEQDFARAKRLGYDPEHAVE